jgi:predicted metal-dependent hydrolase
MDQSDKVQWGDTPISYRYEYKLRKTLAIHVHPDLSVDVWAPLGTSLEDIRSKVMKRGAWIRKSWREFELYLPKQPPRQYIIGESHRYLGRQYRLKAESGSEKSIKCMRGYFLVSTLDAFNPDEVHRLMDEWYRGHAKTQFSSRLIECYKLASLKGISFPSMEIRKLKSRWGSCTKSGKIILNIELIKVPVDCIDYVILHELCHLKEHHHGPAFWSLLESLMPDYEKRRARLNLYADL